MTEKKTYSDILGSIYKASYRVVDCEHQGDIDYAITEVKNAGGIVDSVEKEYKGDYGDSYEDYEWYIEFHCDTEKQFNTTCRALHLYDYITDDPIFNCKISYFENYIIVDGYAMLVDDCDSYFGYRCKDGKILCRKGNSARDVYYDLVSMQQDKNYRRLKQDIEYIKKYGNPKFPSLQLIEAKLLMDKKYDYGDIVTVKIKDDTFDCIIKSRNYKGKNKYYAYKLIIPNNDDISDWYVDELNLLDISADMILCRVEESKRQEYINNIKKHTYEFRHPFNGFGETNFKTLLVKHELFGLGSLISEPTKQTFYEQLYNQLESIVKDDSFEKNGIRNFILSHIPEDYKNDDIEGIVEVFYQRLRALKCGTKGLGEVQQNFKDLIVSILSQNGYTNGKDYTIRYFKSSPYEANRGNKNVQECWIKVRGLSANVTESDFDDLESLTNYVCGLVDIDYYSKKAKQPDYDSLIQQYWFSSTKEEYMPLYPDFGNGILKGKELEQKKKYFDTIDHNSFPLNYKYRTLQTLQSDGSIDYTLIEKSEDTYMRKPKTPIENLCNYGCYNAATIQLTLNKIESLSKEEKEKYEVNISRLKEFLEAHIYATDGAKTFIESSPRLKFYKQIENSPDWESSTYTFTIDGKFQPKNVHCYISSAIEYAFNIVFDDDNLIDLINKKVHLSLEIDKHGLDPLTEWIEKNLDAYPTETYSAYNIYSTDDFLKVYDFLVSIQNGTFEAPAEKITTTYHVGDLICYKGIEESVFQIVEIKNNRYIVREFGDRTRTKNEIPFADKDKLQKVLPPILKHEAMLVSSKKTLSGIEYTSEHPYQQKVEDYLQQKREQSKSLKPFVYLDDFNSRYKYYYGDGDKEIMQLEMHDNRWRFPLRWQRLEQLCEKYRKLFLGQLIDFKSKRLSREETEKIAGTAAKADIYYNIIKNKEYYTHIYATPLLLSEAELAKSPKYKKGDIVEIQAYSKVKMDVLVVGYDPEKNWYDVISIIPINNKWELYLDINVFPRHILRLVDESKRKAYINDLKDDEQYKLIMNGVSGISGINTKNSPILIHEAKLAKIAQITLQRASNLVVDYERYGKTMVFEIANKKDAVNTPFMLAEDFFDSHPESRIPVKFNFDIEDIKPKYAQDNLLQRGANIYFSLFPKGVRDMYIMELQGGKIVATTKYKSRTYRPYEYIKITDLKSLGVSSLNELIVTDINKYFDLFRKGRELLSSGDFTGKKSDKRNGVDWLKGKDANSQTLTDTFGLRSIMFGTTKSKEMSTVTNNAYNGFMDLSMVCGFKSPLLVSHNGTLGLNFGAKKLGDYAAYYRPANKSLNLTRTEGSGSFAHEWFHSLDNYLGILYNIRLCPEYNSSFISWCSELSAPYNVRNKKLIDIAYQWGKDMRKLSLYEPSAEADRRKKRRYWSTPHEVSARCFSYYVRRKLAAKGYSNDYLVDIRTSKFYPQPVDEAIIMKFFDNFFKALQTDFDKDNNMPYLYGSEPEIPEIENAVSPEKMTQIPQTESDRRTFLDNELQRYKGTEVYSKYFNQNVKILGKSINEICKWAAIREASVIAALNIDGVIANATYVNESLPHNNTQKKKFRAIKMYELHCVIKGFGTAKLMVAEQVTGTKITYCITEIQI